MSAWPILLWLGRHGSFFQDEWSFIAVSGMGTPTDWFTPHNEHWSTLPLLLYRALVLTVGLKTYLPFLGILLVLHIVAMTAVFVLLRRLSGPWIALAASPLLLFFGDAYQNLFWAFQIGFVGSAAAGLWALVVLGLEPRTRGRDLLAAVLLLAGVMCSTMGLAYVAAAATIATTQRRWRALAGVAVVGVVFLAWYVTIGRSGTANLRITAEAVASLPQFLLEGMFGTVRTVTGMPDELVPVLLLALLAVAFVEVVRRRIDPVALGAGAGILALFVLIGIGRFGFPEGQATRSRYLYETGPLVLIFAAALLRPFLANLSWPKGPLRRRLADVAVASMLVLLAAGLARNALMLPRGAAFFKEAAGELRAQIDLMDDYGASLPYRAPPPTRWSIPPPEDLARFIALYGTPARDALWPSVVRKPTKLERDRALWRVVGGTVAPTAPITPGGSGGAPPPVATFEGGTLTVDGTCLAIGGPGPTITVLLSDGAAVTVESDAAGSGSVGLGRAEPVDSFDRLSVQFPAASAQQIFVPRLGDGSIFRLQVAFPAGTSRARLCPVESP